MTADVYIAKALAEGDIHIKVMNFVYCLTIQLIFIILFASILSVINLFNWIKTSEEQKKETKQNSISHTSSGQKTVYCPAGQYTDLLPDHVIYLGQ